MTVICTPLIPMVHYLAANLFAYETLTKLGNTLPRLGTMPNIFVYNFGSGSSFPFVSIASLPLITFLFVNRKRLKGTSTKIFFVIVLICFFILMGRIYPFRFIVNAFSHLPVLKHIRHPLYFEYLFTLGIAFLMGYGFDAINVHNSKGLRNKIYPLLGLVFIVCFALILDVIETIKLPQVDSLATYMSKSNFFNFKWEEPWKMESW